MPIITLPVLKLDVSEFDCDKRLDGWKLKKDVPLLSGELRMVAFLVLGEPNASIGTMLAKIRKFGDFVGQPTAE